MEKGLRLLVSGRVQGVGYRYHCASAARELGLKGYVKNLETRDVEIEVFGPADAIERFVSEITRTDMAFRVDGIQQEEIYGAEKYGDFTIRFY